MNRRVQFKPRFFLLVALLCLAVIAGFVVFFFSGGRGELKEGTMQLEERITGVVIRDERSISTEKYQRVSYAVEEGARVFPDTPVATVYKWGYNDEMAQTLAATRTDIYTKQMEILDGIEYPELTVMELSIKQKEDAIRECAMNGTGSMLQLETELNTLLNERATYLRSAVQPTEELTALYAQEETKLSQISAYATDVSATEEGVVSFYFDGYEEALNADNLDTVTAELINAAAKGGTGEATTTDETRLYRLINDTQWYIAFVTPASDPLRVVKGEQYTLVFDGYEDNLYVGTALEPIYGDSGVLNMIQFNISIDALINVRSAKATLTKDAQGLEIPCKALSIKDGMAGLNIHENGESNRVEVDVLASDGETAIIRSHDGTTLYEGMKYKA